MGLKRCAIVFAALDDSPAFDLDSLLAGGDGLAGSARWRVMAPHLSEPVEVDAGMLDLLARLPRDEAVARGALEAAHGAAMIDRLCAAGLLLEAGDAPGAAADAGFREVAWWPAAAMAHYAGAWASVDVQAEREAGRMPSARRLVADNGPAPAAEWRLAGPAQAQALPRVHASGLDELLARRRTCRNFLAGRAVPLDVLATMLFRTWGATGTRTLAPGVVAVRKTSPAGGGLHSLEAFVLARRVEGLAPGLYHYLALQHALEPVRALAPGDAQALARQAVAGQAWFEDAPVMVVMVARFDRLFWKYRRHAKAWRVAHLDAGHLSQTAYLSAADLGLGAFVTAAINDAVLEQALGLQRGRQGVLAVFGFGYPDPDGRQPELDPVAPTPALQRARAG